MRLAVAIGMVVLATACAVTSEPVVVQGTLVDGAGQSASDVTVVLDAFDNRGKAPGEGFEQFELQTTTGPDGRFEFRFAPSDQLRRLAGANARPVNFAIAAFDPRRQLTWSWSFSRAMGATNWQHQATPVRLVPVGGGS